MGKTAPVVPSWVKSLDALIAQGVGVRAICADDHGRGCGGWQDIDLEALRAVNGGAFSLFNRRCRCRITPGCTGWNRFYYINGMAWAMWDDTAAARWSAKPG